MNFLADPALSADICPAIWRSQDNPGVVVVAPSLGQTEQVKKALRRAAVLVEAETEEGRHLVLAGTHSRHRLLMMPAIACGGYIVRVDQGLTVQLAALTAFHEAPGSGKTILARAALRPSGYISRRLALLLTILDRLDASSGESATVRQIACELVFPGLDYERAIGWKSSSQRRHTQRLVTEARRMMTSGYRALLGGSMLRASLLDRGDDRNPAGAVY